MTASAIRPAASGPGRCARRRIDKGGGSLYRLDPDLSVHKMWGDITVANGIAWSHDAKTMYYIDTPTKTVVAFEYNVETGAIANPRPVVHTPDGPGFPGRHDHRRRGDAVGGLLGRLACRALEPDTPARRWPSSSCRWSASPRRGSAARTLDELYITSARIGLSDEALAKQPHAGSIFVARPGVRGLPAFEFAG